MTEVYVDDYWQSVDEKEHPQDIPASPSPNAWVPLRWMTDAGSRQYALMVLLDGKQDYDYAIRVRPKQGLASFGAKTLFWHRIERYPKDPADRGTRWQGPITLVGNAVYLTGHTMDAKGGKVGHGYGVSVRCNRQVIVDQYLPKLDPRHYPGD